MCGIFGIIAQPASGLSHKQLHGIYNRLFLLSETRGKEAAGVAVSRPVAEDPGIGLFKSPQRASQLLKDPAYHQFAKQWLPPKDSAPLTAPLTIVGHSRLVTNGDQYHGANNQPVARKQVVSVHNGIVVNVDALWQQHSDLTRHALVDTEVITALLDKQLATDTNSSAAIQGTFRQLEGMASVATLLTDRPILELATNNGSLYLLEQRGSGLLIFASERFILEKMRRLPAIEQRFGIEQIHHMQPGNALQVELTCAEAIPYTLSGDAAPHSSPQWPAVLVDEQHSNATPALTFTSGPVILPDTQQQQRIEREFEGFHAAAQKLKRCTRCVLPETMPFVDLDEQGVCRFCRDHTPYKHKGRAAFEAALAPYRKRGDKPDCIVPFSGGRDSSYELHYLKKELGLNPIAYTYDWGMVTDLARRNQSRLCGQLGVEHILVSADIPRKRANIRRNVLAWMKKPDLGVVPLFMAGDKQFFWYARQVGKQNDTSLIIFGDHLLERTYFKSGFCGARPHIKGATTYALSRADKLRILTYYGGQFLSNPSYLNSSLLDSLGGFLSFYVIPHDFLWIYHYIPWDEQLIDQTLQGEYDWELSSDTKSSWRIGDGTASFYNYIYYVGAGFTEHDTLCSNLIREGLMTREQGLARIARDNQPRWDSFREYCALINIDPMAALDAIHAMPKRYRV
uniref:Glutamine amidotransferase type-2 domain-containing protein n=1 Tax=Magnetococcus massalia (strain MO-1) TaxID=451514 RepID=A0A1S7LGA2_MAGMO|nr:conserved protein of unknown function [Candidatus Magnetococcus massalia]